MVAATVQRRRSSLLLLLLLLPGVVLSFSVVIHKSNRKVWMDSRPRLPQRPCCGLSERGDDTVRDSLSLTPHELEQQMARLRSKYPTSEADYLAAARARSAAKVTSREGSAATDEQWQELAQAKRDAFGDDTIDGDWERSRAEAGNSDSQILLMTANNNDGGDDQDDPEPKLLLF